MCTKTQERSTKASGKRKRRNQTPSSSGQEAEKWPPGAVCELGAPHRTPTSSLPRGGADSPLSSLLRARLGWKLKPRGSSAASDTITQEGQTSFESLIFKSENLENSATSPLLTAHHPLKRKASCRLTQTQTSLSQRRTYPLRSGPLLRQLPTLSENRERGRRIRDICWLLHPSAQLDRSSPFWKWPKYIFIWILF